MKQRRIGHGFGVDDGTAWMRASAFGQNINYCSLWSSGQYSGMLACANLRVREIVCVEV
jgi:hypothetical protein